MTMQKDVLQFMTAMAQLPAPLADFYQTPPATLALANRLMFGDGSGNKRGEVREMEDAWKKLSEHASLEHLTEFVDGAIDSIYVILWTLHKLGVPVEACWAEVQRSNMAKLGPEGKPIKDEAGKVVKPAGWTEPDLFGILASHTCEENYVGGIARHG